jgi:spermidine/putrescine transport system substrate-binding protein
MTNRPLPALPPSLGTPGHNRRDFLRRAAMLGLLGPAALAACSGGSSTPKTSDVASGDGEAGGDSKRVRVASWTFYIENDENPTSAATIKKLMDQGWDVDYQTSIEDNVSFTEKYTPDLKEGKDFGYDICIPTSWMCARWIEAGWAQQIAADKVPNKANIIESLANPAWDAGRAYTLPYAIGQVGFGYYPDKVGFEITSLKDFLKPELAGKVTLLSEMRDSVGTFMLMMGIDPTTATVDEALKAIAEIKKYRDKGHFKKITGNSYTEDLNLGDTWAALGWSGDISAIQAEKPELKWSVPSDGGMSFVDTMIIPKGANADAAAGWMNHIYDPKVAGPLYEAIGYTTPVKGAADSMSAAAKESVFINPPASVKLFEFRPLTEAEAGTIEDAFAAATQQ